MRHFIMRRLHSLTGILFGGYLIVHLLVNATLVQGRSPDVYQNQVNKIHDLPFLPLIEWTFIYIPILFHGIYGTYIAFCGRPNNANYPYEKNWYYLVQRISAILLIFFILFHVLTMKGVFGDGPLTFDPHRATDTAIAHINHNGFIAWVVYPLGVLAATVHLANGFWTAGITWGLTVSASAQRRWGFVCFLLFLLTFGAGMTAWLVAVSGWTL
jgi:succinate dehydrogenase / fumarate reductase cytochrome b subunit